MERAGLITEPLPSAPELVMSASPVALSFDIEDWFHSELISEDERRLHTESIVRQGTTKILDLLRKYASRATFFVLGDVVREHPDLVRRIVDEGHELASHGMDHRTLWRLDPNSFADQLGEFRRLVERAVGAFAVTGFRAPCFSLDRSTAWALEVLTSEGYSYDSSIFPARVKMYGVPDAPVGIYRPSSLDLAKHDPGGRLVEFPVAVGSFGLLRLPVAGGFYLRVLPLSLMCSVLDGIRRTRPLALYLHPRECEPERFRLPLNFVDSLITYANLSGVMGKLDRVLSRYRSIPMAEILDRQGYMDGPENRSV
jgi:peptidoglycan-N-acetylglucosamine deacetylase